MMQGFKCRLCDLAGAELPTGMTEGYLLRSQISGSLSLGKPCRTGEGAGGSTVTSPRACPREALPLNRPWILRFTWSVGRTIQQASGALASWQTRPIVCARTSDDDMSPVDVAASVMNDAQRRHNAHVPRLSKTPIKTYHPSTHRVPQPPPSLGSTGQATTGSCRETNALKVHSRCMRPGELPEERFWPVHAPPAAWRLWIAHRTDPGFLFCHPADGACRGVRPVSLQVNRLQTARPMERQHRPSTPRRSHVRLHVSRHV